MAGHPNSLANLRPWPKGEQPKPGPRYLERMLERGSRYAPQAIRLIGQAMKDPELPMATRLRCAEFIVDKTWPKAPAGGQLTLTEGIDWLELRFVAPGSQQPPEVHRITFDGESEALEDTSEC